MAISSGGRKTEVLLPKKWKERETSPERTKVWIEPKPKAERKVPVVYYLSRNGLLEHPHFMEVSLSSNEGLYLRGKIETISNRNPFSFQFSSFDLELVISFVNSSDVINRLNFLRGKGMSSMYSWSSKR